MAAMEQTEDVLRTAVVKDEFSSWDRTSFASHKNNETEILEHKKTSRWVFTVSSSFLVQGNLNVLSDIFPGVDCFTVQEILHPKMTWFLLVEEVP